MGLEIWNIEKGKFRPHLDTSELINLCQKLPINYNSQCFFHVYSLDPLENYRVKKMTLYFDIVYEFNLQLSHKTTLDIKNIDAYVTDNGKILDISSSNYFNTETDPATTYLIEAITNLKEKRFIDGFPKLVMWLDKYFKKNGSGFCAVRDSCIHPDLYGDSREKLERQFPNQLEFETDNSLNRNSGKNIKFLQSNMTLLLREIKPHFLKLFFDTEPLLEDCVQDRNFFTKTNQEKPTSRRFDRDVDGKPIIL